MSDGITVNGEPVVSDVNVTNTVPVSVDTTVPVQNASGTALATYSQSQPVFSVTLAKGATLNTTDFAVPSGTASLAVNVSSASLSASDGAHISLVDSSNAFIVNETVQAFSYGYGLVPNISDGASACGIAVTQTSSNNGDITVQVFALPPGSVTVSEIINTPGTPVYVNLAQPEGNWAETAEPQPGAVGPSITHTPPTGKSTYVTYVSAGLMQNGNPGAAFISYARLSGTYGGVANKTVWEGPLGVGSAQGDSAQCPPFSGGAIKFDQGSTVTLSLSGTLPATAVYGMLSMLGYDQ